MSTEFFTETDDSGTVNGQVCLAVGNAALPSIVYTTASGEVKLAERAPNEWILRMPKLFQNAGYAI